MLKLVSSLLLAGICLADIEHVQSLYDAIVAGPNRKVGFISDANYESVANMLPSTVEVEIISDSHVLEEYVANGTLLAGLLSGSPVNENSTLHTFSSTLISPRTVLFPPADGTDRTTDMMDAIDAAIVRIQHHGYDLEHARSHDFEFLNIHTCKTSLDEFPFPEAAEATGDLAAALALNPPTIIMAALGPYNWGIDGDYTVDPPTGFWPDYVTSIQTELRNVYGSDLVIERQFHMWDANNDFVIGSVLDGNASFTEPYYTVDAFFNSRARKRELGMACTTIGYDSTFFTLKSVLEVEVLEVEAQGEAGYALSPPAIILIIVGGVALVVFAFLALFLIKREKDNNPVFTPLNQKEDVSLTGVESQAVGNAVVTGTGNVVVPTAP